MTHLYTDTYTHIYVDTHTQTYKYIDFLGFHDQFLLFFFNNRAKEIALSVLNQVNLPTLRSEKSLVCSLKLFLQFYGHFNVSNIFFPASVKPMHIHVAIENTSNVSLTRTQSPLEKA